MNGLLRTRGVPIVADALLLAWRNGWLPRPAGSVTTQLRDGRVLRVDIEDRTQRRMAMDRYEPAETRLVRAALREGDVFVDVGAHVGWFTTLGGRAVGAAGLVHAIEPFPRSNELLRTNVDLNRLGMVRVHSCAASDKNGTVSMGVQAGSDSGSVTAAPRDVPVPIKAQACRIDDLVGSATGVRLMKIDVEGFEAHALAGARGVLTRTDAVLVELNARALKACGTAPAEIRALLIDAGLDRHQIVARPFTRRAAGARRTPDVLNLLATRDDAAI